jgi:hypothetical protein
MAEEQRSSKTESGLEYWLELLSSALLAVAVVATAYSAYEATRWSGVQAIAFAEAGALRNQSLAAQSTANAQTAYDALTFGQFVFEFRDEIQETRDFAPARELAEDVMRDEFLVYVDEWLSLDPLNNPAAPATPFDLASFSNAAELEAESLVRQAEAKFEEGRDANQTGDNYILATVFFASVLFFTGISSKFQNLNLRTAILGFAAVGLIVGLVRMLTLPFQ